MALFGATRSRHPEGSTLRSRARRQSRRETARKARWRTTPPDLRELQALKAKAQERRRDEISPAGSDGRHSCTRPAESVETLRAGSGGTWRPRDHGSIRPHTLKSAETLRRAAERISLDSRREPGRSSEIARRGRCESTPCRGAEAKERSGVPSPARRAERIETPGSRRTASRRRLSQAGRYILSRDSEWRRNLTRATTTRARCASARRAARPPQGGTVRS